MGKPPIPSEKDKELDIKTQLNARVVSAPCPAEIRHSQHWYSLLRTANTLIFIDRELTTKDSNHTKNKIH